MEDGFQEWKNGFQEWKNGGYFMSILVGVGSLGSLGSLGLITIHPKQLPSLKLT